MPILVQKNVRIISSPELIGPVLAVESVDICVYKKKGTELITYELFYLEDGSRRREDELIFLEVDVELLVAMRLEARILAENKKKSER